MSENKHIIYTAEDIHRYFSGKMTTSQMHAMEKAALNDPLLAEAMEGFSASPSFSDEKKFSKLQKELNELKSRLSVKNIKERRYNTIRWKAAAAVLLLVGTVLALYIIKHSNNKQENIIAKKENVPNARSGLDSIGIAKKQDSITTATVSNAPSKDIASTITVNSSNNKMPKEKNEIATIQPANNANMPADKQITEVREPMLFKTQNAKSAEHIFSGKITDAYNNEIPYANLIINNKQQSKTDANGMFNLSLTDSVIRLDIVAANYYPKTITITANNYTTITLAAQKNTIKKNNTLSDTLKRSLVQVLYKRGVEPKRGWEEYRLFLVDQLSNSEYDDGRRVTGETIFNFEINRLGQPDNFNFEKSIDQDINDALENLIITGPEWRFLENADIPGTVRLRIVF